MEKFLVKKRSAEDSDQPPPTKKSKPATKFNSSHSQEFSIMKSSQKGDTYAFCTICVCDISIASGGRDAIKRHVGGLKHLDAVKLKDSSSVQKVTGFFAKDDDLSVIRAEVLWTQFVIEKNLPLSVSDDFGSLLKQMCKDSHKGEGTCMVQYKELRYVQCVLSLSLVFLLILCFRLLHLWILL